MHFRFKWFHPRCSVHAATTTKRLYNLHKRKSCAGIASRVVQRVSPRIIAFIREQWIYLCIYVYIRRWREIRLPLKTLLQFLYIILCFCYYPFLFMEFVSWALYQTAHLHTHTHAHVREVERLESAKALLLDRVPAELIFQQDNFTPSDDPLLLLCGIAQLLVWGLTILYICHWKKSRAH